jgi:hypothetical protein
MRPKKTRYNSHHVIPVRVWDDRAKGFVAINVELNFDLSAIAIHMARKARRNRNGETKAMTGAILAAVRTPS